MIAVGDRVGTERQTADRGEIPVGRQLPQQHPDQRAGLVVQSRPAKIDVVVGFPARGQGDPTVHNGQFADQLGQPGLGRGIRNRRRRFVTHRASLTYTRPSPAAPSADRPGRWGSLVDLRAGLIDTVRTAHLEDLL